MPGEGNYASPFNVLQESPAHEVEGDAVQVFFGTQFNAAKVTSKEHGIFSRHVLDIRALQGVVLIVRHHPVVAVEEVVLVAVGNLTFFGIGEKAVHKFILGRFHRLFVSGTAGRNSNKH